METAANVGTPNFGIISLTPCGKIQGMKNILNNPAHMRKPPCSPKKKEPQNNEEVVFTPSPIKKRTDSNKENTFSLKLHSEERPSNELGLFNRNVPIKCLEISKISKKVTRKASTSCTISKNYEQKLNKSLLGNKFRNLSQNIGKTQKSSINCGSPMKPTQISSCVTPDTQKTKSKVYTPILTAKKRKISSSEIPHYCKRISLFDTIQSKMFEGESSSFYKEQSTQADDSSFIGEFTPIRNEESLQETFPEQSYVSPLQTIQIITPPEKSLEVTPEEPVNRIETFSILNTELMINKKGIENFAPKKVLRENSYSNRDFFSLSSSSDQDLISDVSFSEEVQPTFGEGGRLVVNSIDREMQTDPSFSEIFDLLNDSNVVNGLKTLGKINEILKLIKSINS
ncbi:hypothetical protein SteCoe_17149 [Stentor coeruleus]|uniref:Uncharacterized protein n=1 Tax=Stentor coeruleus TaxID=5963 RepID=A0A1R2BZU0_9CILI|nr:hypothetical protein SteCoe_17149 [Stentor coeruleus]